MNEKEQFENGQHRTGGEPDVLQMRLRQETEEGGRGDGAVASNAQPPAIPPTIHITVEYGAAAPKGRWKGMVAGAAALVAFLSAFTTIDRGIHGDAAIWVSSAFQWILNSLG